MPRYELNRLGPHEFEQLAQALIKEIIGDGTVTFGSGPDGAREATYTGTANYPGSRTNWSGDWVFQVKFHDIELVGTDKARKAVVSELRDELQKVVGEFKYKVDNYVFITNVPLSPKATTGTLDRMFAVAKQVAPNVKNIAIWGADDINRFLDKHISVRTSYLHLIVPGDLIAELLAGAGRHKSENHATIRSYLETMYAREQYAQLDQAGDVTDKPVKLPTIFLELHADGEVSATPGGKCNETTNRIMQFVRKARASTGSGAAYRLPVAKFFLSEEQLRVVLVGGPGEGKSTVGQYLAQLHRAQLLGRVHEVAIAPEYCPATPRLPLRVILREFGQWLSELDGRQELRNQTPTLEHYICEQIARATSRAIAAEDLHAAIRDNPTLLILDGLDEVTDPRLKKEVVERAHEFIRRVDSVLDADLQVLATTRPTGYGEQFDSESFVHLDLLDLEPGQVRTYVKRWTKARELDPGKGERLERGIEGCLSDPHVGLLMKTPLQVTILVLIISAGGTPPRQREALFNEYLEVIYKREQGKGSEILSTDKELLIGLHKFVGYELHERATHAAATDTTLTRSGYRDLVSSFLSWNDPYSDRSKRDRQLDQITVEAGERLVLIVESISGRYGFELRSIQEFFAACHMVDTASSTEQRYARFESVVRLPHWKNVALFAAGRVGRNFQGEASNIVEVCRTVDREGIDIYLRRGSWMALSIAFDRALLPNRRLQHSLLEVALELLEGELSQRQIVSLSETLREMPREDKADHIEPILKHKLDILAPERLRSAVKVMADVMPKNVAVLPAVGRMLSSPSTAEAGLAEALNIAINLRSADKYVKRALALLSREQIVSAFSSVSDFSRSIEWLKVLIRAKCGDDVQQELVRQGVLARMRYSGPSASVSYWDVQNGATIPQRGSELILAISEAAILVQEMPGRWTHSPGESIFDTLGRIRESLPSSVVKGSALEFSKLSNLKPDHPLMAGFWALHLTIGDVSRSSLKKGSVFFSKHADDDFVGGIMMESSFVGPALSYLRSRIHSVDAMLEIIDELRYWCGFRGIRRWIAFIGALARDGKAGQNLRALDIPGILAGAAPRYLQNNVDRTFLSAAPVDVNYLAFALMEAGPGRGYFRRTEEIFGNWQKQVDFALSDPYITTARTEMLRRLLRQGGSAGWSAFEIRDYILKRLLKFEGSIDSSLLIYALLAASEVGTVSERIVRGVVDRLGGEPEASYYFGPPQETALTELYKLLLQLATNRRLHSRTRRGACRLLLAVSLRPLMYGLKSRNPRYGGFVKDHRRLAESNDLDARLATIALFAVRGSYADPDADLLKTILLSCDSEFEVDLLRALIDHSLVSGRHIDFWRNLLTDLLSQQLHHTVSAVVRHGLNGVLSQSNQSLQEAHEVLELPLA